MGGAVLAEADRVVRPDERHRDLHQRRHPDRGPHVVAEDEERAAVGPGQAVQGDPVEDAAHAEFPDPEVQGPAVRVAGELLGLVLGRDERRLAGHRGVVAARQVGRTAPKLGQHRRERGQHLAGGRPRRHRALRRRRRPGSRRTSPAAAHGRRAGRAARAGTGWPRPTGRSSPPTAPSPPCRGRRPRGPWRPPRRRPGTSPPGRSRGSPWWPRPRHRRARSRAPRRCSACSAPASR